MRETEMCRSETGRAANLKGMRERGRGHWAAPHGDGLPKYLWEPVCESEQNKSLSDWKQLLLYFCNSMLYKTGTQLLSGDEEMEENLGQNKRPQSLFDAFYANLDC